MGLGLAESAGAQCLRLALSLSLAKPFAFCAPFRDGKLDEMAHWLDAPYEVIVHANSGRACPRGSYPDDALYVPFVKKRHCRKRCIGQAFLSRRQRNEGELCMLAGWLPGWPD